MTIPTISFSSSTRTIDSVKDELHFCVIGNANEYHIGEGKTPIEALWRAAAHAISSQLISFTPLEAPSLAAPTPPAAEAPGQEPVAAKERRDILLDLMGSLAATISLLERYPKAKQAAPSNKMFGQMLVDYRASLERARKFISAPPTYADAEAKGFARGVEVAAQTAEQFTGSQWIAFDMKAGTFPEQSKPGVAIAAAIRSLASPAPKE